jgi:spore coat polysaccharide biosynthesis protein SpsF
MGSSRLPGKVLRHLGSRPVLERMLERLSHARTPFDTVVATTVDPADEAIVDLCRALGVDCYRGHRYDLLDRHYRVALERGAEVVLKIPSDCPLIDPRVIDRVLARHAAAPLDFDYVSNLHPATYPDGNDVEVMSITALATAWLDARRPLEREHATPYLWEHPELFRVANVTWQTGLDLSMTHRMTLDYEEDLVLLERVFALLCGRSRVFSVEEVVQLLDERPELRAINARYAGVNWYRHHLGELRTIAPSATRQIEVET